MKPESPDIELINAAIWGNQAAYTLLVNRYKEGLTIYIYEFLGTLKSPDGNTEMAEEPQDVVQEAFNKAFQALPTYNPQYKFSTWLFNIARNIAIDYSRKRKIPIGTNTLPDNIQESSPEEKLISFQEYSSLIDMINSLSPKYKDPAILRFIKEYEYNEIAQELNLELNTVKTRLKRAKEMLKKMGAK